MKINSLKIKIIIPLIAILVIVFLASSLIIIDREYNVAKNTLIDNAESYASLSVGTLVYNYENYYASGYLKFSEIVDNLIRLNQDIIDIHIIDVNGKILFTISELTQGKYDEQQQGQRIITDPQIIQRAITLSPSLIINESANTIDIMQPYLTEWGRHDYSIHYFFTLSNLVTLQQEMYSTLLFYSGIFSIISFALIFVLFNRFITTPIGDLIKGIRTMGEGHLGEKIHIRTQDELGELANTFNRMSTQLKKSQDNLKEYSENLELLVTKRTEELEDKTANLEKINKDLNRARKELNALNKNLEKRIKERTHEVEILLKQKDDFINQLSHDLKSPLMPMTILIPLLEKQETNEKKLEYLQVLKRNVEYMKNIAVKTLQLAKLNSPRTRFQLETLNLTTEIAEIISNKKTIFDNKKLTITNNITKPIYVQADKLRIDELFSNILENAVKYSHESGVITIDAKNEKEMVTISVKDQGIGMTQEQMTHIFDEFYKADESRHDFDSSGLGLAICKKIIERHNGKIWVKSPGIEKGSTIFFSIPLSIKEQK